MHMIMNNQLTTVNIVFWLLVYITYLILVYISLYRLSIKDRVYCREYNISSCFTAFLSRVANRTLRSIFKRFVCLDATPMCCQKVEYLFVLTIDVLSFTSWFMGNMWLSKVTEFRLCSSGEIILTFFTFNCTAMHVLSLLYIFFVL